MNSLNYRSSFNATDRDYTRYHPPDLVQSEHRQKKCGSTLLRTAIGPLSDTLHTPVAAVRHRIAPVRHTVHPEVSKRAVELWKKMSLSEIPTGKPDAIVLQVQDQYLTMLPFRPPIMGHISDLR